VTSLIRLLGAVGMMALLVGNVAGCGGNDAPAHNAPFSSSLRIGFGLSTGQNAQAGVQGLARSLALEPLVNFETDGRSRPRLAESWTTSEDGLLFRLRLRPNVTFHDGKPVTASIVTEVLQKQLPRHFSVLYEDISSITPVSANEIEFALKRRSALLVEGLDVLIGRADAPGVGTGPFITQPGQGEVIEMVANERYHSGRPGIGRISIQPYASVRSAWADMLRGQVDMLYEVGADALESLQPSTRATVFTYQRPYAYVVMFNMERPQFRDRRLRQALNAAIDRKKLVADAFDNHGSPAESAVWPLHWAYSAEAPTFKFDPQPVSLPSGEQRLTCLFAESSLERLMLGMQRQLQTVGVDLNLELLPVDEIYERVESGSFDLVLADAGIAPNLFRPYLFFHSGTPYNYGRFASALVDKALDNIRHAPSDDDYKAAVAAFQGAIVEDPPGIFLTWSQRARAVSTRFEVPVEPGRDILSTLRLWRPINAPQFASRN
jgi:peptide/nickel transport system substrate-binding protein